MVPVKLAKTFHVGRVYLVTNLVNDKRYVGQTIGSIAHRWRGHIKGANRGDTGLLAKAIRKYGRDNFNIEELHACTVPLLDIAERSYVKTLNTLCPAGYNLTTGGRGNHVMSSITRRKISIASRAQWADPAMRAERSRLSTLQWTDKTYRLAKSTAMKELWADDAVRAAASAHLKELWLTDETARTRRDVGKAAWRNGPTYDASMAKLRLASRERWGTKRRDAERQKVSDGVIRWHARRREALA